MTFAGISNELWPIPSGWRAFTTTGSGRWRMRLASSRAGTLSPMRPSRIRRGGQAALGMAVWPMQTCLSRLLIRSRVWGGTTPVHVAAARSSRSAASTEAHSGRPLRACYEDSSSDPFCLAPLTLLLARKVEDEEDLTRSLIRPVRSAGVALHHAEQFRGGLIPVGERPLHGLAGQIVSGAREGLDRGFNVHRGPPSLRKQVRPAVASRGVLVRC